MKITRDSVLRVLGGRERPALTAKEILTRHRAPRGSGKALRPLLRRLADEGRIERDGKRYRLCRRDGLVEGTFAADRDGDGGVVSADSGDLWQVEDAAGARAGDRVVVQPIGTRPAGEAAARGDAVRHGVIVSVIAGERRVWVGIYERTRGMGTLTPYRDDRFWSLRIAERDRGGARHGEVVVAAPTAARSRSRAGHEPSARIVERLGLPGDPEADFRAIVWRRRLPVEFPPAVLQEAEAVPETPPPAELERRVDLRDRCFVTIDPATARDHDDAVCVEDLSGGGARLWVAIADVSHFVPAGSALDREALRRGNSVYFPDRAIPMLPERLSGELCSLRPEVDRLALVAEMEIGPDAAVLRRGFYPAQIRSRARLSYEEAAAVMEPSAGARGASLGAAVESQLRSLAALAVRLMERRFARGSIDFDLPAAEIVLGDESRPVDIVETPRTIAHRAIEEAMLAANRSVAAALVGIGAPCIYRVHEPPGREALEALQDLLASFSLVGRRKDGPLRPLQISRALAAARGRPEERLVNLVALRSMRQARYEVDNLGHFALGFDAYLHFTSPIRRYADLVVHRVLKERLRPEPSAGRDPVRTRERFEHVAARVSARERIAMEAERESIDLKKCAFMAQHVGREFEGTISGVARQGLYVTLDDFFVEGLVHVSKLPEYVELDERRHALVSRSSGRHYRLGDRVRVRVESVDLIKAWINFEPLFPRDHGPKPRDRTRGPRDRTRRSRDHERAQKRSKPRGRGRR